MVKYLTPDNIQLELISLFLFFMQGIFLYIFTMKKILIFFRFRKVDFINTVTFWVRFNIPPIMSGGKKSWTQLETKISDSSCR